VRLAKAEAVILGRIAQVVEQLTLNQRVVGSSPTAPTSVFPGYNKMLLDALVSGRQPESTYLSSCLSTISITHTYNPLPDLIFLPTCRATASRCVSPSRSPRLEPVAAGVPQARVSAEKAVEPCEADC
jgi:hypothetical protein